MNSHQRRKAARYWKHQYELPPMSWGKCIAITKWCEEHFGPKGCDRWHYRYISTYPTELCFWFHIEKDAAWFKLNWL